MLLKKLLVATRPLLKSFLADGVFFFTVIKFYTLSLVSLTRSELGLVGYA